LPFVHCFYMFQIFWRLNDKWRNKRSHKPRVLRCRRGCATVTIVSMWNTYWTVAHNLFEQKLPFHFQASGCCAVRECKHHKFDVYI
jgi:hypothetical protein